MKNESNRLHNERILVPPGKAFNNSVFVMIIIIILFQVNLIVNHSSIYIPFNLSKDKLLQKAIVMKVNLEIHCYTAYMCLLFVSLD